ncbi:MAG: DUF1080 domain-containing protein [Planctomycetota bacterium]
MSKRQGYTDTPTIPGQTWKVHDIDRPYAPVVTPGGDAAPITPPPSDATVLFDGDLSGWVSNKDGGPAGWRVEDGVMEVVPGTGNICTRAELGDGQFHLEFAEPEVVKGEGQGRGNSGVFLMSGYEVQVLDSYENPTYADGQAAALYGLFPPLVNACRPPGVWQSYDILWVGPRFDGDTVTRPATITVLQNGVAVHHALTLPSRPGHRGVFPYQPHPPTGPLMLQDHGDLVRFRNIWFRPFGEYS